MEDDGDGCADERSGIAGEGIAQDLEIAVIGPIRSAPSPQYVVNAGTLTIFVL
ncbi:hypothetical protein EVAR_10733_1, partial [Eumeta japonica]